MSEIMEKEIINVELVLKNLVKGVFVFMKIEYLPRILETIGIK